MRGEREGFSIGIPRAKERSGKVTQSFPCFCGAKSCKRIPGTSRPNVRDRIIYRVAQPSLLFLFSVENGRLILSPLSLFYSHSSQLETRMNGDHGSSPIDTQKSTIPIHVRTNRPDRCLGYTAFQTCLPPPPFVACRLSF